MKLMECVPNFSEGRDSSILNAIAAAIKSVKGVVLLDMDPGADTNRTVFTIAGEPEAVVEAAFQAIKKAAELIDFFENYSIKKDNRLELILNNQGVNEGLYPLYKIQKELQHQVNNVLPSSPNLALQSSLNRTPLTVAYPNSDIAQAYLRLAQYIYQRM